MKKIRIGNDIYIRWCLFTQDGIPYLLDGKNLKLFITNTLIGSNEITDFTTENNTVIWTFKGKNQETTGAYSLTLIENDGEDEMRTIDICKPFTLVSRSISNNGECCDHVDIETLELVSNFDFSLSSNSGSDSVVYDSFLSETSENAVQNNIITNALKSKQDTLVSGENMATINGNNLLEGGNIEIVGGSEYSLPTASVDALGCIKTGYTSTNENRAVEVDSEGNAYVNIPTSGGSSSSGSSVTVDKELSNTSTNPVENQAIAKAIEEAVERGRMLAKRDLFESIGAVYNDTGEDIIKDNSCGIMNDDNSIMQVTHKAGCWLLNDIGDLTDDDMSIIYSQGYSKNLEYGMINSKGRTNIHHYGVNNNTLPAYYYYYNSNAESINLKNELGNGKYSYITLKKGTNGYCFGSCSSLKYIIGNIKLQDSNNSVFFHCKSLVYVNIAEHTSGVYFDHSPQLSLQTIKNAIQNVKKTITDAVLITLHADTYAKCTEGGEWYDEVQAALNTANGYTAEDGTEVTGTITGGGSINIVSA